MSRFYVQPPPNGAQFCRIRRPEYGPKKEKTPGFESNWGNLYAKNSIWEIKVVYDYGGGPEFAVIKEADNELGVQLHVRWAWIRLLSPLELLADEAE